VYYSGAPSLRTPFGFATRAAAVAMRRQTKTVTMAAAAVLSLLNGGGEKVQQND
jgi:hypothetical protein